MSPSKFFSKDFYSRIDRLVFNVYFSEISATSWRVQVPLCTRPTHLAGFL